MKLELTWGRFGLAAVVAAAFAAPAFAQLAGQPIDVGSQVPDAASIKDGLFPEDACKELEASGFKCMGLKPAIHYALPASSFKVGSAELPELLKKQLDVFAEVLRGKKGSGSEVRVVGHADASGTPEQNQQLSVKRAEAVKEYLVQKGATRACWSLSAWARTTSPTRPIRRPLKTAASRSAGKRRSSRFAWGVDQGICSVA